MSFLKALSERVEPYHNHNVQAAASSAETGAEYTCCYYSRFVDYKTTFTKYSFECSMLTNCLCLMNHDQQQGSSTPAF